MQPEYLLYFAKFIEKELGIVYADHNFFQLQNRLEEIAKIYALPDVGSLYEKAKEGLTGTFKQLVLDVATNNETSFFRDPKVFQAIEKQIVPVLAPQLMAHENLRIWSAACSNGQEPYSLYILLTEFLKKSANSFKFEIQATDISERVLEKAKKGRYSQLEIQRGLSTPLMLKYFTKDDQDYWTIKPEAQQYVSFGSQNLKEPLRFSHKYHVILCRNILIYQKVESKTEILSRILECLVPGGYLILGAGESLLGISDAYQAIQMDGVIFFQKKDRNQKAA